MSTLLQNLPLPERRREIIQDCCLLLDDEVKSKRGVGGLAVKAGYKLLKAIKPGAVTEAVDGLLDGFLDALEKYHADWRQAGSPGTFGSSMKKQPMEIAEDLVRVTDRKAENTRHKSLKKMYLKLRPSAVRNVQQAIPGLADLMDKHYRASE